MSSTKAGSPVVEHVVDDALDENASSATAVVCSKAMPVKAGKATKAAKTGAAGSGAGAGSPRSHRG